jgi:rhomboid family GlyGly-CTERM serine protease
VFFVWFAFLTNESIFASTFAFNRDQAISLNWWQWVTAHFVHTNFVHYAFNMIGLALLWFLHGEYATNRGYIVNFLLISVGISLCILVFSPDLGSYVGMSGVLHGIFAWGVIIDISKKRKSGYLLMIGLIVKLADEQWFSSSTFMADMIGVNVAIDAHLYGAIIGLLVGILTVNAGKSIEK